MKKAGFHQKTKSLLLGVIISFALCCGLPILLLTLGPFRDQAISYLKSFILNPVPKSVEILDSYDGGADFHPDFCLHFKISPADFQLIFSSKKWETVPEAPFIGLECEFGKSAWNFIFPPPALGSNAITYTFIPRERDIEIMFTNTQMNEVYYFYHDGNIH